MSNTILTPTAVTREALRILHQKLNFVGTINRQYDDSFAQSGAKIGSTLKIRLPNQYTVRTGAVMDVQDTAEDSVTLTVGTQKGVDVNFTSNELTLSLDDFSSRILDPAMSVLAANIEADVMNVYKDVYQEISDVGATTTLSFVLNSAKKLTDSLTPSSMRTLNLNTQDNVDLINALSGLFNPQAKISQNFKEGMVANQFVGYSEVYENTMWPIHTTGTDDGTGDYLADVAAGEADGSAGTLHVDTGAGTFLQGDIVTIDNVFRVHPETKVSTGILQKFVITADSTTGEQDLSISPSVISSGAKQNVNAAVANNAPVRKRESDDSTAIGASADYHISMGYHRDAFALATADLVMPKGVDFTAREVMDGISMRVVRAYDINNDKFPCRLDVLYGYKTIRAELACRLGFN